MSWRALATFLLLGAALLLAKRATSQWLAPRPMLVVSVPADAGDSEVQAAVDEALLVDLAVREGWAESDPVVRDRLLRNMRFASDDASSDGDAIERALTLGMHRSDPVVRQRLALRARQRLASPTPADEPSDDQLKSYLEAHAERFATPPRARFVHILLSRQRRGADLEHDAERMAERLRHERPSAEVAERWSDPSLLAFRQGPSSAERIDAAFGGGFGQAVVSAEPQRWTGPLRSSFGLHFVRVEERDDGSAGELPALRSRVRHDLLVDGREARVRAALVRYRADYRVQLERTP